VNSLVYRLKGHHASLVGCQSVEDSPEIITADTSGVFKLWDVRNFQCVQTFSANLSGHELKDSSRMTCFFQCKLPSRNSMQKEDDSRVYAASKNLFSFDQARVVHEATTDYFNVLFIAFDNCTIITASERNVIVWDALVGSKTFAHTDICGSEISACCLDDRKRKILIGDVNGHIGVYNCSNGQLMKGSNHSNSSVVVSLQYYDNAKRFIAGFSNGQVGIFDENEMEECILIRSLESYGQHAELLSMSFHQELKTILTAGEASVVAKLWDYDSGKCDFELKACAVDSESHIVHACFLAPYPLAITCDSGGNVIIWGTKGCVWEGKKIAGFMNLAPVNAEYEPRMRIIEKDEEEPPRRVLIPSHHTPITPSDGGILGDDVKEVEAKAKLEIQNEFQLQRSDDSVGDDKSTESLGVMIEAVMAARQLIEDSQKKWGKASAAEGVCWDAETGCVILGNSLGHLSCYDINDMLDDLQLRPEEDGSQSNGNGVQYHPGSKFPMHKKILGICKAKDRNHCRSALPPKPMDIKFQLGASMSTTQTLKTQSIHSAVTPKASYSQRCQPSTISSPPRSPDINAKSNHSYNTTPFPSPHPNRSHRKSRSTHSTVVKYTDPNKNEFVLGQDDNAMSYLGVKFRWMVHAHDDRILYCKTTTHGFLTSSADRLVKMWTFEGRPIGTLLQSVPNGARNQSWGLLLNVDAYTDKENEDLDEIIDSVKKLAESEDKPDIRTMDFKGMQLGEESADFSRSLLRQRIDKTSKFLGIDFPHSHGKKTAPSSPDHNKMASSDESSFLEDVGSLSYKSMSQSFGSLPGGGISVNGAFSLGSKGKSLEDALKELKSPESAIDYDARTKKLSDIQKKRKELRMESLHRDFESRTGTKIKTGSITSTSLGDSFIAIDKVKDTNGHKSKAGGEMRGHEQDVDIPAVAEEKSLNDDLNSLSNSAILPPPPANVPPPNGKRRHAMVMNDSRRGTHTTGKIAEKLRQVKENGLRNIAMQGACQKYDSFAALEVSMKQQATASRVTLNEQQLLEIRTRSEARQMSILVSMGQSVQLTHSLMRRRAGLAAVVGLGGASLSGVAVPPLANGEDVHNYSNHALRSVLNSGDSSSGSHNNNANSARSENGTGSKPLFHIQEENLLTGASLESSQCDSTVLSANTSLASPNRAHLRFDENASQITDIKND